MKKINWGRVIVGGWLLCFIGFLLTGCGIEIKTKSPTQWVEDKREEEKQDRISYNKKRSNHCIEYCNPYPSIGFSSSGCLCSTDQGLSCPAPGH